MCANSEGSGRLCDTCKYHISWAGSNIDGKIVDLIYSERDYL